MIATYMFLALATVAPVMLTRALSISSGAVGTHPARKLAASGAAERIEVDTHSQVLAGDRGGF